MFQGSPNSTASSSVSVQSKVCKSSEWPLFQLGWAACSRQYSCDRLHGRDHQYADIATKCTFSDWDCLWLFGEFGLEFCFLRMECNIFVAHLCGVSLPERSGMPGFSKQLCFVIPCSNKILSVHNGHFIASGWVKCMVCAPCVPTARVAMSSRAAREG